MSGSVQFRKGVFVSYSRRDKEWLEKFQKIIAPLAQNESVRVWDDTAIQVGSNWKQEIEAVIAKARVAVLLVTPNFLASKFITEHEFPQILTAQRDRGLTIFWIAVSATLYERTPLKDIQSANDPNRPLDSLSEAEQNRTLVEIAKKLEAAFSANSIANSLRVLDQFYDEAEAYLEGKKSVERGGHSRTASQDETSIRFRDEEGQEVETITRKDLETLPEKSRQRIRTHESTMEILFDRWTEIYPKRVHRDEEVKKRARRELEETRREMCKELNAILDFLMGMGKALADHYEHVRDLCKRPAPAN